MMILVTGASSSGKSAWAENRLLDFESNKRVYVATMIPWDEECVRKIERHRAMRAEKGFITLEHPVDLSQISIDKGSAVLLECLSNLAANEIYRDDGAQWEAGPEARILEGLMTLARRAETLVVVTNQVFSDGVEYPEETKRYMAILGNLNRRAAEMADEVVEVVCGIPIRLKGQGSEAGRNLTEG